MADTALNPDTLLTPEFMRQLDRLDVRSRKMLRGTVQGERRSKKRGASVEFADYRNYVVGDDLRRIDWNLYARLDKLFLRLFMEEEDLSVSLVIDTTVSMDYGEPNKLLYAKQMVAALGYIALTHYNRLNLYSFTDTVAGTAEGMRGRRPIPRMVDWLNQQQPTPGEGNLAAVCKKLAMLNQRPGVVVLVSDFFDKGDLSAALRYLAGDRYDAYAIQLLSPQEVDPAKGGVVGDLKLTDMEDGDLAEVSVSKALLEKYQANLQAYCQHVRDTCTKRGMSYMTATTDLAVELVVLKYLRERGLLG
ncbi:DUF58 domain-containing protein [Algisphaera agarilytica]|uniref:Uncharacterized protein (DUF58 family) n=1 Tax=Algisphaera agarilytica TaxID=1385975 RepID=A0A7X0LLU0_9BACT|nr:DUF58 domain-containing protein [Algisphaera agarilytica]MBB6430323.1 uncharacterized protein (DUF58 family) [Algisphaera agarilytica]